MKIKTIPRMLAMLLLCLTVIMSISTTVFAVDDNANNTGENGAGIANKPGYVQKLWNFPKFGTLSFWINRQFESSNEKTTAK